MAQLVEIVGEHGIIIFEGEKPVSARQIVFIVGERGEVRERIASEPFKLEPGKHRLGEHFPRRQFLALFEELFPDDYFFPDDFFFPDDYFPSGDDNPIIGEQVFDEMKMEKGQIGLVVAVQPEDLRAGEEMIRLRPKIHPMGFVLSHDRK